VKTERKGERGESGKRRYIKKVGEGGKGEDKVRWK
jgi:hypothetical protein